VSIYDPPPSRGPPLLHPRDWNRTDMLQGFRNLGKSWLGKLIVGVLFGLLILSFAIWGIGDVFRGYGVNIVATVGDRDITIDQMRTAYQNELQQLSRRFGRSITSDQARALGLDQQVLGRLIAETALDERASELGLAVSRETVGEAIVKDPAFRNASGQFDRFAFDSLLRANGLTEQLFITEQQAVMARRQLADALTGAIVPPLAMREAVYRYGAERRNIAYVELPASLAGDVGTPEEAALQAFFDERKADLPRARVPHGRGALAEGRGYRQALRGVRRGRDGALRTAEGQPLHHARDPQGAAARLPLAGGGQRRA